MRATTLAFVIATSAGPAPAEVFSLALPVDCTLGKTCFIEDYPDADPGPGARDFTCGIKTRDGHRGTDFALPSFASMEAGVDVLAAAPGVVDAVRDGIEDEPWTTEAAQRLKGRECGNAVRIKHQDGWQTLYCHLANGSLRVAAGDSVDVGAFLGRVGMSGQSNYPHAHVTVLKNGIVVDPFSPTSKNCEAPDDTSLYQPELPYTPTGIITAGFSDAVPDFDAVTSGSARRTEIDKSAPLVLYAYFNNAEKADVLHLSAQGPTGQVFERSLLISDPKRGEYRAYGRKAPAERWAKGSYRGYARLMRGDTLIAVRHADVIVR